jgi:hypothetical protein
LRTAGEITQIALPYAPFAAGTGKPSSRSPAI